MRFQFIDDYQDRFCVRLMCRLMQVSPSGYYACRTRGPSKQAVEDGESEQEIVTIHDESHEMYGYRRIYQELLAAGKRASWRRVARLIRKLQRQGRQYRRYVVTTKQANGCLRCPTCWSGGLQLSNPTKRRSQTSPTFVQGKAGCIWL